MSEGLWVRVPWKPGPVTLRIVILFSHLYTPFIISILSFKVRALARLVFL